MQTQRLLATSTLASALVVCAAASAGPDGSVGSWGGFYVDGAIGARSSTTQITSRERGSILVPTGVGRSTSFSASANDTNDVGQTNFLGQLSGGWRWADGPVVVGLGAFVDWAGNGAGTSRSVNPWSTTNTVGAVSTTTTGIDVTTSELKQKSRYGISLDIGPNWRTHPYAKVSYAWSEYELSASRNPCDPVNNLEGSSPSAFSFSNTLSGFGIGGGVRHMQTQNLYFFAEVMWQDYGSKTNRVQPFCSVGPFVPATVTATDIQQIKVEPTNVTGVVGVGWKF